MPRQLEVRPEIADKLVALPMGVSIDDLLQEVLAGLELPHVALTETSVEEFERDMDALSEGLEHLPVAYQGNYSREDIYLDHDCCIWPTPEYFSGFCSAMIRPNRTSARLSDFSSPAANSSSRPRKTSLSSGTSAPDRPQPEVA
jgi:hypothetical protein